MLLRGQNIVAYKHYPDDVVIAFVKAAVHNGIDIFRIFDALNDVRNLETALKTAKKEGAHAQCCISYTISPVHNIEYYVKKAIEMENLGADTICIKDMAGILTPYTAFDLVTKLKKEIKLPINLHSHCTGGFAQMTYLKAIEAGVDILDTAISPFSAGTSQPTTESLVVTLRDTPYDTGLNMNALSEVADYFKPIKEKYLSSGLINTKVLGVDTKTIVYQVPGGMLSNLVSQLQQQNKLDKFQEVLEEVPRVREDLGYPPLVTPLSQIVGTQAVLNVVLAERYKMIPKEVKDYVKGLYGKPTIPIKQEIVEKIVGKAKIITCRPADLIEPQMDKFKNEMKEYLEQEEDILSYALFPQVAMLYFKNRWAKKNRIETTLYNEEEMTHPV